MTFTLKSKKDMYSNLTKMLETGKLKLPVHKKLLDELFDLRYELTGTGEVKIHHAEGGKDDYPDALALGVWFFRKAKSKGYFIA